MTPFNYPNHVHIRRHAPVGYLDVASFRPWLRDEFNFRCVYCLRRERWEPNTSIFEIDHILPVSHQPERTSDYCNLVYSCAVCNLAKGQNTVADPSQIMISITVSVATDGVIHSTSRDVQRLIRQLDLNDPQFILWRKNLIRIIELAAIHDPELHQRLLGYPDELPNLHLLKPPQGNLKPGGIEQSTYHQRLNGTLPALY